MTSRTLARKKLPDTPGVYFFLGRNRKILYIGKATSLRNRVWSYFQKELLETRGPLIARLINEARSISFRQTGSVLEALLLEADLIKKFQPPYNTKEKDDRSYNCVVFTKETFSRVLLMRDKDVKTNRTPFKYIFGPFPHGTALKEALRIIRKIFPFRDSKCSLGSGKPCFNYQLGLCPGTCIGAVTAAEYRATVRRLKFFFEGDVRGLKRILRREMNRSAVLQEFEKAETIKRSLFALEHIQDVALMKRENESGVENRFGEFRIEAYDIAHTSGSNPVGVMVAVVGGRPVPSAYRKFKIRGKNGGDDIRNLEEMLSRRLNHPEWSLPKRIVVDGGMIQKRAAEKILRLRGIAIPVASVLKDDRHRPKAVLGDGIDAALRQLILLANSEAHRFAIRYHRSLRGKTFRGH